MPDSTLGETSMNVSAEPTSTAAVSDEALRKAEQYIEEEEGAANHTGGRLGIFLAAVAIVMSVFHLYAAYATFPTQPLRPIPVACVLLLSSHISPVSKRLQHRLPMLT